MKFIDDKSKNLKWWNRNYFFVGTIFFIVLNILIFAIGGNGLSGSLTSKLPTGDSVIDMFYKFFLHFCGNFTHADWEHVLQNMLGFSFCLFYIERKFGTINLLELLFVLTIFSSFPYIENNWIICGSSIVWFACFGFVVIDLLFSFRKKYRNKTNIIIGAAVIFLEYIRCGFYDDYSNGSRVIKWGFNPVQLTSGHAIGFLVGLFVCLLIHIVVLYTERTEFTNKQ